MAQMRLALTLAMGAGLLLGHAEARASDCYDPGTPQAVRIGDVDRYEDTHGAPANIWVASVSEDPGASLQSLTLQRRGGPFDPRRTFLRRAPGQDLDDGWDSWQVVLTMGGVIIHATYLPPIPTTYPLCPGTVQHSTGLVAVTALGYTLCTGTYERTLTAFDWQDVSVPYGALRALRVENDVALAFDCDGSTVDEKDVSWLVPGLAPARIDSAGESLLLVAASRQPVPEADSLALDVLALLTIAALRAKPRVDP